MRDFTLHAYRRLLNTLLKAGYVSLTFQEYCDMKSRDIVPMGKYVILRHDVDSKALNSLKIAQIEAELGLKASYYFRVVPQSNQPEIIRKIISLGHEIGYHYEDVSIAHGDIGKALEHFKRQLAYFRMFYPVKTICMHGAPMSAHDNRDLWKIYDYRNFGIIGEPYFDIDFSKVFYLTDTGRCWDGYKVSVRDRIDCWQKKWDQEGLVFHTTDQLIEWLKKTNSNQRNLMITTHPQRWTNSWKAWSKELVMQKIKNVIKRILITLR